MRTLLPLLASAFLLFASCQGSPGPVRALDPSWEADARALVDRIGAVHPNPWRHASRETVLAAALRAAEPDLPAGVRYARLTRALGLLREGHTLPLFWVTAPASLPMTAAMTSDGLVVTEVRAGAWMVPSGKPEDLAGARITALGGQDIGRFLVRCADYASAENVQAVLAAAPRLVTDAEVLADLGLLSPDGLADLELTAPDGRRLSAQVRPLARGAQAPAVLASVPRTEAQRRSSEPLWDASLADGRIAYLAYNACSGKAPFAEVTARFLQQASDPRVQLVVVDLRFNGGGSSQPFSEKILPSLAALSSSKKIRVLGGLDTFSSAIIALAELRQEARALFVGEATSEGYNSYGEVKDIVLPHSKYEFITSSKYFELVPGVPEGLPIEPDRTVLASAADWNAGRDPVLESVLAEVK